MRTAVLHWSTSSVGGINSVLQAYRKVAEGRGDTFDVLASDPQRTKRPERFAARRRVRGGDSYIQIDGHAPYHTSNMRETVIFLHANYDQVMTSYICPHPTKAYGAEPLFLPFLEAVRAAGMPLLGYVHDAYWDTYREWAELVLPLCERVYVTEKAYGEPLLAAGYDVTPVYVPFTPLAGEPEVRRNPKRLVWLPQWKNIKGISQFFDGLPALRDYRFQVGLYNNGIEYYKMRLLPEWSEVVDVDYFTGNVNRHARQVEFHGCLPLERMPEVLAGAGFMADFQGHKAKHAAYLKGSYNSTIIEALYYGTVPVVHANMLKSDIPAELLLPVSDLSLYPEVVRKFPLKSYDRARAREYVADCHSAERLYDQVINRRGKGARHARTYRKR